MKPINSKDVIQKEQEHLLLRRQKLGMVHGTEANPNWFGIALSGGGIRSATINLGFLKTLNKYGILQKADYLSSVSGGGYTHSYVQGTAKETGDFSKLFNPEHIEAMRAHGEYMVPQTGLFGKTGNLILLIIAFVVSWLMSLVSPVIVAGIAYSLYMVVASWIGENPFAGLNFLSGHDFTWWAMFIPGLLLASHFLLNIVLNFNLGISKVFNRLESVLVGIALLLYVWVVIVGYKGVGSISVDSMVTHAINAVLLLFLGFFTNPNALSFHRYYRKQLADLFLRFSGKHDNMPLGKVFDAKSDDRKDYISPYPLINTCLNLMNPRKDEAFQGTKTSDYFLLSPFYCGSKLVGYVPTDRYADYQSMTLPAAVTISAAAVNPGMGMYSNKVLSLLMTIFNFRLGFWISNPKVLINARAIVWWPLYFFYELLGRIGSKKKMINISDGGHIENLGAYELLRRGCRLIIAVDAGEDKSYSFADLNNFLIRARNEMGLEIRFRAHEQPEELIRPRPSQVYSAKRYAVADIYKCWEEVDDPSEPDGKKIINYSEKERNELGPVGTFVYVKSSVRAPEGKPDLDKSDELKYGTYKYKIYHPDFPHEPTSDQFFDKIQWEAYFQLGRYIGAEVLGVTDLEAAAEKPTVEALLNWFDKGINCFETVQPTPAESAPPTTRDAGAEDGFESFKQPSVVEAAPAEKEEVKYQM
jgi:ABC-type multidrug transport system fused ATPase/permease subunit